MSLHERVARVLFETHQARTIGRSLLTWDKLPASSLDYWGGYAQAALDVIPRVPVEEHDQAVRRILHHHREQRAAYSTVTTGCSCGWAPCSPNAEKGIPSLLQQYLQHVAEQLRDAS